MPKKHLCARTISAHGMPTLALRMGYMRCGFVRIPSWPHRRNKAQLENTLCGVELASRPSAHAQGLGGESNSHVVRALLCTDAHQGGAWDEGENSARWRAKCAHLVLPLLAGSLTTQRITRHPIGSLFLCLQAGPREPSNPPSPSIVTPPHTLSPLP